MFGRWGRREGFADAMIRSFPPGLEPPEPLVRYFRWQEKRKLAEGEGIERLARLSPEQRDYAMFTQPVDPRYGETWIEEASAEERLRLAPFARTGGDGSVAALWRDDAGETRIVHIGSGSGSTLLCVLADDPVDFLRLLAIGYSELCWPESFAKTPAEVELEEDAPPSVPVNSLAQWVTSSFGCTIPRTASEIVTQIAEMDDADSQDPFWRWMRRMQLWGDDAFR